MEREQKKMKKKNIEYERNSSYLVKCARVWQRITLVSLIITIIILITALNLPSIAIESNADESKNPNFYGTTNITLKKGDELNLKDSLYRIFAKDYLGQDITKNINVINNTVDTDTIGAYTITYNVEDQYGNSSQIIVPVNVTESTRTVQKTLYMLEDMSYLDNSGILRGNNHDKQNLGIYMPGGTSVRVRQINSDYSGSICGYYLNNDRQTETKFEVNNDWTTLRYDYTNIPFIQTNSLGKKEANEYINPIIEIDLNDVDLEYKYGKEENKIRSLNYFRQGDNQDKFFENWDYTKDEYSVIENERVTMLIPICDRNKIVIDKNNEEWVKFYEATLCNQVSDETYFFNTIDELLEWYKEFQEYYDKLIGLELGSENLLDNNVLEKYFVKADKNGAGYMYYGYYYTAFNGETIETYFYKGWGVLHEFGHGYQGGYDTDINLGEVKNNVFAYYCQLKFKKETDKSWLVDNSVGNYYDLDKEVNELRIERAEEVTTFEKITDTGKDINTYTIRLYCLINLLDKTDVEKTLPYLYKMYRREVNGDTDKKETAGDRLVEAVYETTGYNCISYLESWNITVSDTMKTEIKQKEYNTIYYLREICNSEEIAEDIRTEKGLKGLYSLVDLEDEPIIKAIINKGKDNEKELVDYTDSKDIYLYTYKYNEKNVYYYSTDLSTWRQMDTIESLGTGGEIYFESEDLKEYLREGNNKIYIKGIANGISTDIAEYNIILDTESPIISLDKNGGTYYIEPGSRTESIGVQIIATDLGSGINNIEYQWSNSNTQIPICFLEYDIKRIKQLEEGTWYLWVRATDNTGKIAYLTSDAFIVNIINAEWISIYKSNGILYGDVNGDNIVNEYDVQEVIKESRLENITLSEEEQERADVNDDGIISLKDAVIIKRYINNYSNYFKAVQIKEEYKVDNTSIELDVNSNIKLISYIYPEDTTNQEVIWTSDNENVAIVNEEGLVETKGIGIATITATSKDGGYTANCTIITDKEPPKTTAYPSNSTTYKNSYEIKIAIDEDVIDNNLYYYWTQDGVTAPTGTGNWLAVTINENLVTIQEENKNGTWYLWIGSLTDLAGNKKKDNCVGSYNFDNISPYTTKPTAMVTSNSITVTNEQTDDLSGIASVKYAIYKDGAWSEYQSSNVFSGLTANTTYKVKTTAVDNAGNSSVSEKLEITTPKASITRIEITKEPDTTIYVKGAELDLTGGEITATYEDGTTTVIDMINDSVEYTGYNANQIGEQTIEIAYSTEGKNYTTTLTITVIEEYCIVQTYQKDDENLYITKILPETTYKQFINNIKTNMNYKIYENGKEIKNESLIKTGQELVVESKNEPDKTYKLVVIGDINKDGKITMIDLVKLKRFEIGKENLEEVQIKSGDININGKSEMTDISIMQQYLIGKIKKLF